MHPRIRDGAGKVLQTTKQQVSGIKCAVYCLPVLPLGKQKKQPPPH